VESYPQILFKSTKSEVAGNNLFKVFGDLTLHSVTWPILLHAEYFGPTYFTDETGSYTTMGFTLGNHIDLILNAEADLEK
jgi:polyisoprenoid-binding protein YceI